MRAENERPRREAREVGLPAGPRLGWALLVAVPFLCPASSQAGPFIDAVVQFVPGRNTGFGQNRFPSIVLGPPEGAGALQGSLDVLSLGHGGEIVVRFDPPLICDGPGLDFIVFENPFHAGSPSGPIFAELGIVAVSQDGVTFRTFPYDPATWQGLAGQTPVYANSQNGVDPADPNMAGGDAFDLAEVGFAWAAFVRITDAGDTIDDPGNHVFPGNSAGFDLDAIVAIHPCDPEVMPSLTPTLVAPLTPTPSASATSGLRPSHTPSPQASFTGTVTTTPSRTPTATASLTPSRIPSVAPTAPWPTCDAAPLMLAAFFDENAGAELDLNHDGRLSVADLVLAVSGEMVSCAP